MNVHIVLLSSPDDERGGNHHDITVVKVWADKNQADEQASCLTTRRDMAWVVTRTLDQS